MCTRTALSLGISWFLRAFAMKADSWQHFWIVFLTQSRRSRVSGLEWAPDIYDIPASVSSYSVLQREKIIYGLFFLRLTPVASLSQVTNSGGQAEREVIETEVTQLLRRNRKDARQCSAAVKILVVVQSSLCCLFFIKCVKVCVRGCLLWLIKFCWQEWPDAEH